MKYSVNVDGRQSDRVEHTSDTDLTSHRVSGVLATVSLCEEEAESSLYCTAFTTLSTTDVLLVVVVVVVELSASVCTVLELSSSFLNTVYITLLLSKTREHSLHLLTMI